MRLQDWVTIISGEATGIGRAIRPPARQRGDSVTVLDVNDEQGSATAGAVDGLFIRCDASDPQEVRDGIAHVVSALGDIDVLVTAAARTGGHVSASEMPEEQWQQAMAVSLDGVYFAAKHATRSLNRKGGGAVVHIASVEGMIGSAEHTAFVTAKSAQFGLTRSMASDYGGHGTRVNAISPGIIDSGRPDIEARNRSRSECGSGAT